MQETLFGFLGGEVSLKKEIGYPPKYFWASLVAQTVKNLPAMQETWVQSLSSEDPVEELLNEELWADRMGSGCWGCTALDLLLC